MKRYNIPFLLLALCLISCTEEETDDSEPVSRDLDYPATVFFIEGDQDTTVTIQAAIADDDQTRSAGLMDVHDLPEGHGMLFLFEDEEPRSFWMANTPLPLDIIFVNEDREIVRIHQNTRPYSDRSVESEVPAMYAVEVNAGFAIQNDIREGMRIAFDH